MRKFHLWAIVGFFSLTSCSDQQRLEIVDPQLACAVRVTETFNSVSDGVSQNTAEVAEQLSTLSAVLKNVELEGRSNRMSANVSAIVSAADDYVRIYRSANGRINAAQRSEMTLSIGRIRFASEKIDDERHRLLEKYED